MNDHDPIQAVLAALEAAGTPAKRNGQGWVGLCPAHGDTSPSLSISQGDDGRVLLHCHGGCKTKDIVAALGLEMKDLFPPRAASRAAARPARKVKARTVHASFDEAVAVGERVTGGEYIAHWAYPGDVLRAVRFDLPGTDGDTGKPDKKVLPMHSAAGGWVIGDPPGLLPLYRGDELPAAGSVVVTEGEKCCDVAWNVGLPAVTSSHGHQSAKKSDWKPLAGREVVILPDHDDAGHKYAEDVAAILIKLTPPAVVKIVDLPDLAEKGDIVDWIGPDGPMMDRSNEQIIEVVMALAAKAPYWTQPTGTPADAGTKSNAVEVELCSDVGNAARFTAAARGQFLYCGQSGKWLRYDGRRWVTDDALRVVRLAKTVALDIYKEARAAAAAGKEEQAQRLTKWALASQRRQRLTAMVDLARCELSVSVGELDADPWLLNVLNGTIDLRTGKMMPHRPEDRITKLAPVTFDPDARCPLWDSFLDTTMASEQAKVDYLQRIHGMCLTGDVREQALFLYYGTGANGKSVFLDTLAGLMGDYAAEAAPDLLIERRNQEHPTEQADLCGRRLVVSSETEEGGRLRVQLIKRLTGNARIKARFMRQDYFEFTRTHKLVMATNNKPVVRETTHAVWRRLKLIPFTVTIPDLEQDKELIHKLRAEWSGILNWAIAGCLAWQRNGLDTPEVVDKATAEYEAEQDLLTDFINEHCIVSKEAFVPRADIYKAYTDWATAAGERFTLNKTNFYARLRQKHFTDGSQRVAGKPARGFEGIGLRSELFDNVQA